MNQEKKTYSSILWSAFEDLYRNLEKSLTQAAGKSDPAFLESVTVLIRRTHWIAAFLGLTDLATLTALGAASVRESKDSTRILEDLLRKMREFLDAREDEPLGGVYVDKERAVFRTPLLKQPVSVDELIAEMRKKQSDRNKVPICKSLTVKRGGKSGYVVHVPSAFWEKTHDKNRGVNLVHINLVQQKLSVEELANRLDKAFLAGEILSHGPLEIPLLKSQDHEDIWAHYLLINSAAEAETWLKGLDLDGRLVRTLYTPDQVEEELLEEITDESIPTLEEEEEASPVSEIEEPQEIQKSVSPTSHRQSLSNRSLGIRFSVGTKLSLIVSLIIVISMITLTYVSTFFFSRDTEVRVDENNITLARLVASQTESELLHLSDSAKVLHQFGAATTEDESDWIEEYFANARSLIYVGVPEKNLEFVHWDWFREHRITDLSAFMENFMSLRGEELEEATSDHIVVVNASPFLSTMNVPVLAMGISATLRGETFLMIILADVSDTLAESVRNRGGSSTIMIVNANGEILVHPDMALVYSGESVSQSPVFEKMYSLPLKSSQIRYTAEMDGRQYDVMAAYTLVSTGNLGVVSNVPVEIAFETVVKLQRQNFYLLGSVLALALLLLYLYAKSLTGPLKELALAARRIRAGNYNVGLETRSRDEVGMLTRSFVEMGQGLEERERMKEAFGRFVNPEVAELSMKGMIELGGEIKSVTVFFSDIRSFTSISENLKPDEVVTFLNEYMSLMVRCINENRGVVDKYIGDAIMALWGTPISYGNDAENAVNSALKMRAVLREFNSDRGGPKTPIITIGCALNSGDVLAGQIGSEQKMEYTVIGDTVNLASRMENLNKPMGTDILVSQSTASLIEGIFDLVPLKKIKVKGKEQPQQIYAVLGRMDDEDRPRTLDELRRLVGLSKKHGKIDEIEETKYEIVD